MEKTRFSVFCGSQVPPRVVSRIMLRVSIVAELVEGKMDLPKDEYLVWTLHFSPPNTGIKGRFWSGHMEVELCETRFTAQGMGDGMSRDAVRIAYPVSSYGIVTVSSVGYEKLEDSDSEKFADEIVQRLRDNRKL